ncbi:putative mature-T-Cell Proliferation I type [Lyophyllum shimeji]|uniref:Cx9C motif-containing protein 4, mitochondrial n=1 Tax=Lyophyllum shimeji TaxID=47721 RepID=A0A9P3PM85_LYOSH|nr:putative mature-T-Cell Proliferation I type [Lyophyllum shimeji]
MSKPPCQAEACSLQECLQTNTYTPQKCDRHLRGLYECCERVYDEAVRQGREEEAVHESTACPMPRVVKRWLSDHPPESKPQ